MKLIVILFACALQLLVPASMIYSYETTLSKGTTYRFEVIPVDPADPFRGRYVRLGFAVEFVEEGVYIQGQETLIDTRGDAFALITQSSNGLAKIAALSISEPKSGDYLKVQVFRSKDRVYRIDFPLDRYYAEESKAPNIERVTQNWRGTESEQPELVTAEVNIYAGKGVISELYVGDQTIHDYLQK